jgi:hypothetical protein
MILSVPSGGKQRLGKKGVVRHITAVTNNDSTLVARGGKIKKTTKQLKAGESTKFKAKLKHPERLKEKPTRPKVKIKLAATDEFDQTATGETKVKLCRPLIFRYPRAICRWPRAQK